MTQRLPLPRSKPRKSQLPLQLLQLCQMPQLRSKSMRRSTSVVLQPSRSLKKTITRDFVPKKPSSLSTRRPLTILWKRKRGSRYYQSSLSRLRLVKAKLSLQTKEKNASVSMNNSCSSRRESKKLKIEFRPTEKSNVVCKAAISLRVSCLSTFRLNSKKCKRRLTKTWQSSCTSARRRSTLTHTDLKQA